MTRGADLMPAEGRSTATDPWCHAHETHSGAVVMLGDVAYKFKKPVAFGFLDFTDRAVRERVCEQEVELNRRLAPDVYLGVGHLLDPDGQAEPAVVMRRLPDERRLSRLVHERRATAEDIRSIARQVAVFHGRARTDPEVIRHGSREALLARWEDNLREVGAMAGSGIDPTVLTETSSLARQFLAGRADLFADRTRRGAIVDGHGDLTPDDIFCLADGPRLLDCLEFDDALRHVDRLDDIAFLAMGLAEIGATDAAERLIETWAECLADPAPPSLVHHYIAYRAFVRAKVGCLRGAEHPGSVAGYAETTLAHLRAGAVKLVLVGGPPASGKSTLAGAVADALGMVVVSSDRVRKEAAGLDPQASAAARFQQGLYDPGTTSATYELLRERAALLLRRGESVLLDASWTSADERDRARALAREHSAELVEIRCTVDDATARERIRDRQSLSDADVVVAARLRELADPWPSSQEIVTDRPLPDCVALACRLVRPHPSPLALLRRRPRLAAD